MVNIVLSTELWTIMKQTIEWFKYIYIYKCPIDEYVAVGSVDTKNNKKNMILAMHIFSRHRDYDRETAMSQQWSRAWATCGVHLFVLFAQCQGGGLVSVTLSLSRALSLSLETVQLFICISQNKYLKPRNTA